jgi:hypothetical protein
MRFREIYIFNFTFHVSVFSFAQICIEKCKKSPNVTKFLVSEEATELVILHEKKHYLKQNYFASQFGGVGIVRSRIIFVEPEPAPKEQISGAWVHILAGIPSHTT